MRRLVRLYLTSNQAAKEDRQAIAEASKREFHMLEKLNHPAILKALVPAESELGPAIVFEFDPTRSGSTTIWRRMARSST